MSPDSTDKPMPDFGNPPVVEVVWGVQFEELPIQAIHLGTFYERWKSSYPRYSPHPPIPPAFERFDRKLGREPSLQVEVSGLPPMPRYWLQSETGEELLQIQNDRFLLNWRQGSEKTKYPRYENMKETFLKRYSEFSGVCGEFSIDPPGPNQLELTYINHIPKGQGWERFGLISEVFPFFAWGSCDRSFLADPEFADFRLRFKSPDEASRLTVALSPALRTTGAPPEVLRLTLTVRGASETYDQGGLSRWFDSARTWIVRGFADLTSEKMHALWERKDVELR